MHRKVSISLPPISRRNELAMAVQHVLQATAMINADWVLQEWAAGRTPKCCAKCNGTGYRPDSDAIDMNFGTSPVIFTRGHASCGEIAACHTGHKIAEAVKGTLDRKYKLTSPISWEEACRRFFVLFSEDAPGGPGSFHAICNDNGTVLDPTVGMKRVP